MIDEKVEKSENCVLVAIEILKADMTDMKSQMSDFRSEIRAEMAELRSDVKTLAKNVADIKVDLAKVRTEVSNQLRTQIWFVGLVVVMLPTMAGVMARLRSWPAGRFVEIQGPACRPLHGKSPSAEGLFPVPARRIVRTLSRPTSAFVAGVAARHRIFIRSVYAHGSFSSILFFTALVHTVQKRRERRCRASVFTKKGGIPEKQMRPFI